VTDIHGGPNALAPISQAQVRSARRLHQRKGRQAAGESWSRALRPSGRRSLDPDQIRLLIVDDPGRHREILALATGIPLVQAGQREIAQLADTVTSQGIFAIVHDTAPGSRICPPDRGWWSSAPRCATPAYAGTVIRCADAYGATG
jgi:TrmH family RNA methyltransferase